MRRPVYFGFNSVPIVSYFPTIDISLGNWTPSVGGTLYGTMDETDPVDGDYAVSGLNPVNDAMEVKFGSVSAAAPIVNTGHLVSYRIRGDGTFNMAVELHAAGTVCASWFHTPVPNGYTQFDQVISTSIADTIASLGRYNDLRVVFIAGYAP